MTNAAADSAADSAAVWDSLPLAGWRTLVTGAASGIGRAIALGFAQAGADVALLGSPRSSERVAGVAEQIISAGRRAHIATVDVVADDAMREVVDGAAAELGGLDTVVAAAGVAAPSGTAADTPLSSMTSAQLREVLAVNVRGTWSAVRHAVPYLCVSSRAPSVITIASVAAKRPTHGPYSVSKAAVWMTTRVLAVELAPDGIRANTIAPGFIDTPLLHRSAPAAHASLDELAARVPLGRIGQPHEVASTAIFLASRLSAYLTGAFLTPDGGHVGVNAGG
jgi:NAD(P)-dependent dehydrogenase (short-subunit alcohol dehydrogenase family)